MASEEGFRVVRPPRASLSSEPTTYVNGLAIILSPWDFNLLFSRALPTEPLSKDPEARPTVRGRRAVLMGGDAEVVQRIVMSPEHAKAMAAQLAENVALYEREWGGIPAIVEAKPDPVTKPGARKPRARRTRSK